MADENPAHVCPYCGATDDVNVEYVASQRDPTSEFPRAVSKMRCGLCAKGWFVECPLEPNYEKSKIFGRL